MIKEMKLGQLMLDIEGTALGPEDREVLLHPKVGGVILFTRNFTSKKQLAALCEEIHYLRTPRLLIAVDQEGGRVQRFRRGFVELPPTGAYGKLYNENVRQALYVCENAGWLMASELIECGVDFSFAPVVDIGDGVSEVIGDRAFHHTVDGVTDLARVWIKGMHKAGMAAVIKHYPGHGGVKEDSHVATPVDKRSFAEIESRDLQTFARIVESGVEGVMTAHVYYPAVDNKNPASFSKKALNILRNDLRFTGAIFSDDLSMEGASKIGDYAKRARSALNAGCDMVVVCNHREGAVEALQALARRKTDVISDMRFIRFHARRKFALMKASRHPRYKEIVKLIKKLEYNTEPQLQV